MISRHLLLFQRAHQTTNGKLWGQMCTTLKDNVLLLSNADAKFSFSVLHNIVWMVLLWLSHSHFIAFNSIPRVIALTTHDIVDPS